MHHIELSQIKNLNPCNPLGAPQAIEHIKAANCWHKKYKDIVIVSHHWLHTQMLHSQFSNTVNYWTDKHNMHAYCHTINIIS